MGDHACGFAFMGALFGVLMMPSSPLFSAL
jgi:hypothetical protein